MAERKLIERTCTVCGKVFYAKTSVALYCPECRVIHTKELYNIKSPKLQSEKQIQKQLKADRKARQKNMKTIVSISNKAREENLSYGEYVVRKGI
jgi:uncharacterized Zn finger protein (UPF0148 family)